MPPQQPFLPFEHPLRPAPGPKFLNRILITQMHSSVKIGHSKAVKPDFSHQANKLVGIPRGPVFDQETLGLWSRI